MKQIDKFYIGSNQAGKGRIAHLLDPMREEDYNRIFRKEDIYCYICKKKIEKGEKYIIEGNNKYRHKKCK